MKNKKIRPIKEVEPYLFQTLEEKIQIIKEKLNEVIDYLNETQNN